MMIDKIRNYFLLSQTVVLFIALIYEYIVVKSNDYTFIFIYSLWNTISYLFLFISEMRFAPDFHPFQILTLSSIQFLGLNGLYLFSSLFIGESINYSDHIMDDIVYLVLIYLSIEHLILYYVFFYYEKKRQRSGSPRLIDRIRCCKINYTEWAKKIYL